jgi:hypothetical protein
MGQSDDVSGRAFHSTPVERIMVVMATKDSNALPPNPQPIGALTGSGALQTVQDLAANPAVQQVLGGIASGVAGAVTSKALNRPPSGGPASGSGSDQQGSHPQE